MVDLSASRHMETLVAEFLWTHPDYDFQSVEIKHPCVLAFFGAREWLIDRLGSYEDNLRAMLAAAREWFPPGTNTPAFRVFCFPPVPI
jgi:hypothetical protein